VTKDQQDRSGIFNEIRTTLQDYCLCPKNSGCSSEQPCPNKNNTSNKFVIKKIVDKKRLLFFGQDTGDTNLWYKRTITEVTLGIWGLIETHRVFQPNFNLC
jgi:hypothetical protein